PADLAGKLYVEYEGEGAALVENLREELQKQEAFRRQQGERYLSPALLRHTGLSGEKCTRLSGMFDSVDAFLEAAAEGLAERLGMSALMVRGAQEELGTILCRLEPER
ncbi:MAG: hypothetical protein GY856_54035, partial [bacterium]|nr:hypothetical protein [bacterium]